MSDPVQLELLPSPPPTLNPYSRVSFYRPHDRMATAYTGEVVDPLTGEVTVLPSMTKQEFKDQCDINNIIKSFKLTGQITHIARNAAQGMYMDLPDELDFQTALNTIREAEEAFDSLPAKIRERFQNDPGQFLAFLSDPANKEEATKLGLLNTPAPGGGGAPPPPTPPVDAPAPPAPKPE